MKKPHWLDRSLITGPYLALCLSAEEYERALAHCRVPKGSRDPWMANEHSDAQIHYLENPERKFICIVTLRVRPGATGIQIAALLMHEAVHVWQVFCERIGENEPSKEFEAYSIQSIAQTLMQAYADRSGA